MATLGLASAPGNGPQSSLVPTHPPARLASSPIAAGPDQTQAADETGHRTERRVLREAQRGSEEALEWLVRRHWPLAHRAAYLVTGDAAAAEDVAQEALVAAIRALGRFDRRRPFGPWLHRIAVNRAIDHVRARASRGEVSIGTAEDAERRAGHQSGGGAAVLAAGPDDGGWAGIARGGSDDPRAARLKRALAELTPEHRAIVAMRFLLDLTPGEIATELGLPRGTVNSRMRRALDHLGESLGDS